MQADHVHEVADGGPEWDTNNGITLCWSCHKRKTQNAKRKRAQSFRERARVHPESVALLSPMSPNAAVSQHALALDSDIITEEPAWSSVVYGWGLPKPTERDTWPRLATAPHPQAVGSYGLSFVQWCGDRGIRLRWWQQLWAYRALEHDAAGQLCWATLLVSTTRQTGKSFTLRELVMQRLECGGRYGNAEPDTVLLTSTHLDVSREVWRPAMLWAGEQSGWLVRQANGEQRIEHPNGARWLIRAVGHAGYGFTLAMAVVDEAWGVDSGVVDDRLIPTLITRQSPQLYLVSTAHPDATPMVPNMRKTLLAQIESPTDALMLEWSAAPTRELDDERGWREASPYWDDKRRAFMVSQWQKSTSDESWSAQWLNRWPSASRLALASEASWDALKVRGLEVPEGVPLVLALDAISGGGATLVTAWHADDGKVCLKAAHRMRLLQALTMAHEVAGAHPGTRLLLGASLDKMIDRGAFPGEVQLAGIKETRQATHLFQSMIDEGTLAHDGDQQLAAQVTGAAVVVTDSGTVMSGTRSPMPTDAARGALWAAWSIVTQGSTEPAIF